MPKQNGRKGHKVENPLVVLSDVCVQIYIGHVTVIQDRTALAYEYS